MHAMMLMNLFTFHMLIYVNIYRWVWQNEYYVFFPEIYTHTVFLPPTWNYIYYWMVPKAQTFHFRLRTCHASRIILTEKLAYPVGDYYEILIGGWSNTE